VWLKTLYETNGFKNGDFRTPFWYVGDTVGTRGEADKWPRIMVHAGCPYWLHVTALVLVLWTPLYLSPGAGLSKRTAMYTRQALCKQRFASVAPNMTYPIPPLLAGDALGGWVTQVAYCLVCCVGLAVTYVFALRHKVAHRRALHLVHKRSFCTDFLSSSSRLTVYEFVHSRAYTVLITLVNAVSIFGYLTMVSKMEFDSTPDSTPLWLKTSWKNYKMRASAGSVHSPFSSIDSSDCYADLVVREHVQLGWVSNSLWIDICLRYVGARGHFVNQYGWSSFAIDVAAFWSLSEWPTPGGGDTSEWMTNLFLFSGAFRFLRCFHTVQQLQLDFKRSHRFNPATWVTAVATVLLLSRIAFFMFAGRFLPAPPTPLTTHLYYNR
jgi:hypothetical protein